MVTDTVRKYSQAVIRVFGAAAEVLVVEGRLLDAKTIRGVGGSSTGGCWADDSTTGLGAAESVSAFELVVWRRSARLGRALTGVLEMTMGDARAPDCDLNLTIVNVPSRLSLSSAPLYEA